MQWIKKCKTLINTLCRRIIMIMKNTSRRNKIVKNGSEIWWIKNWRILSPWRKHLRKEKEVSIKLKTIIRVWVGLEVIMIYKCRNKELLKKFLSKPKIGINKKFLIHIRKGFKKLLNKRIMILTKLKTDTTERRILLSARSNRRGT